MTYASAKSLDHSMCEDQADRMRAGRSKLPELIESLSNQCREIHARMHELKGQGSFMPNHTTVKANPSTLFIR